MAGTGTCSIPDETGQTPKQQSHEHRGGTRCKKQDVNTIITRQLKVGMFTLNRHAIPAETSIIPNWDYSSISRVQSVQM
ncbi:hypothetical protein Cantr_10542 [Candida viswanathii]|uniref:Uncharacterized protein n=1 Tax=Candida viswanathii TaxID=5486 RepID=A0A367YFS9_9ASCO|nr:hypothetical protein Cantr_10542 [Candida viswanathii]